jgi:hypothetical protein
VNERFAILNPCPIKWADLQGDGRSRYCDLCQKHVHAISEYSPAAWNQLWRESNGHVCGLLASESPARPRSRRAILVGALLTAVAPLCAQSGQLRLRVTDITGAVAPGASVSLLGSNSQSLHTLQTGRDGEVVLADLPLGDSVISIAMPGFMTYRRTVTIRDAVEQKVEATLEVSSTTMGEVVVTRKRKWWQIFQ